MSAIFNELINHSHPIIVHFPIVLITLAFIFDAWQTIKRKEWNQQVSIILWISASLSAWLAVSTGPEGVIGGNTTYFDNHQNLAAITSILTSIFTILRLGLFIFKKQLLEKIKYLFLVTSVISFILVISVGYFGGKMVYSDGIGVSVNDKLVNPPQHNLESNN